MTDEPTDARRDEAESDEDVTVEVIQGILRLMDREDAAYGTTPRDYLGALYLHVTLGELLVASPAAIFGKAYVETLARHAGDRTAELVRRILFRRRRRTGETLLGVDDGAAATIVMTGDLPDEARLALLNLDVTAPELVGKELRWDKAAGAWRPELDETASTD